VDERERIWVTHRKVSRAPKKGDKIFGVSEGLPSPIATVVLADHRGAVWEGLIMG